MEQSQYERLMQDFILAKQQMKLAEEKVKKLQAIILSDPSFDSFTLNTSKVKRMTRPIYSLKQYTPEQLQAINETYPHCYKLDPSLLAKEDISLVDKKETIYLQIYTVKQDVVGDGNEY